MTGRPSEISGTPTRSPAESLALRGLAFVMKKYLIVIEETGSGYTAYSPDLPGCVVSGWTRSEVEQKIRHSEEIERTHNRMLEEQETKRLQLMAEKGQIEQAFKENNAARDKREQQLQVEKQKLERAWLDERRSQVINEVMAGRIFVGADEAARVRTANMV